MFRSCRKQGNRFSDRKKKDMREYWERFLFWKTDAFFDDAVQAELKKLDEERDRKEIEDRFYRELAFGTGGLRGIMGAGTNRMNRYTVGRATAGLGQYLLDQYGMDACRERGVAVGYDTRNNSAFFAQTAANVLSGMGIRVWLQAHACPTPQLSFAVGYLHALAGIVITASHNPKEYNGYKVYDEYGCQLNPEQAGQVTACINAVTDYRRIPFAGEKELISETDCTEQFVRAVLSQSRFHDAAAKADLDIVYTPLHGTGYLPVTKVLGMDGFSSLHTVKEQAVPDGDFPTVVSPNPEDRRALEMGIRMARETGADLVLGTDPDADRVGAAVKTETGYQLLTGNQIGALLMDFLLDHTDLQSVPHPAAVRTVVTSELGAEIARRKGLTVFSTLTGFKYIGEKITQFEQAKKNGIREQDYDFIFGYEESYGYLAGTHARDKDASVSCMLICEMAAEAKARQETLADRLEQIYRRFGYYYDALDSFTLKGKDGQERIASIMDHLRSDGKLFSDTAQITDYRSPVAAEPGFGYLPVSDVLKYTMEDGSWIAVRPSGTEPKIKIYYSVKGQDRNGAEARWKELRSRILQETGLGEE